MFQKHTSTLLILMTRTFLILLALGRASLLILDTWSRRACARARAESRAAETLQLQSIVRSELRARISYNIVARERDMAYAPPSFLFLSTNSRALILSSLISSHMPALDDPRIYIYPHLYAAEAAPTGAPTGVWLPLSPATISSIAPRRAGVLCPKYISVVMRSSPAE